jgi:DNA repair exonuclease SbcCD ATPase subunit
LLLYIVVILFLFVYLLQHLAREKEYFVSKLMHIAEDDSAGYAAASAASISNRTMRMYLSEQEQLLQNPSKTVTIMMNLMENNNQLSDTVAALEQRLQEKVSLLDEQAQAMSVLHRELESTSAQNKHLERNLQNALQLAAATNDNYVQLQQEVGQLTSASIFLAQENRSLKEQLEPY